MLKRIVVSLPLLVFAMAPGAGFAQSQETSKPPETPKFYRLKFVVKELDGEKVVNARLYRTTAAANLRDSRTQIRAGGRVPVPIGTTGSSSAFSAKSFEYHDVGVSIDCSNIKELDHGLSLFISADITSVPADTGAPAAPPALRQNKWTSVAIVALEKPTLIFSSDDPTTTRQMQLELTVTPIP